MNSKPALPEELEPGSGNYSFRTDMKVNVWSWVAVLTSFVGEVLLLPHYKDWPIVLRTVVAIAPLIATLLWLRSAMQWTRSMDELQRRVTTAATVFATVTTLFITTTSHLLVTAGVFPVRFQVTAVYIIIWLVVCFYFVGRRVFNRHYQ